MPFEINTRDEPKGDQPEAIGAVVKGVHAGKNHQTLHGTTGTGKTHAMARVIVALQLAALVIVHNKVLAGQLYDEFRGFFPSNSVHLFISTFDTFQPEAYDPRRKVYIKKDGLVDKDIYQQRLATLDALLSRQDVLVVASASAIFGVSSREDYVRMSIRLRVGDSLERNELLHRLVAIKYGRDDLLFLPGKFRVNHDIVDVYRPYGQRVWRVRFQNGRVDRLAVIDLVSGDVIEDLDELTIRPATTFVLPPERLAPGIEAIERELPEQLERLRLRGKTWEAAQLNEIVNRDIDLLRRTGACPGMENYVRALSGRAPGATPTTLFDYFPRVFLQLLDESHATVPQIRNMFAGNEEVKTNLVDAGYRLPSASDLRPLLFEEWERATDKIIFVSATPGDYELEKSAGAVVEQIVRPRYLLDPLVEVHGKQDWQSDLIKEIRARITAGQQALAIVLTKRQAKILAGNLGEAKIKCAWIHSDLPVRERNGLLRAFRKRRFGVLVGVGMLREGVNLPGVSLVAIVDADKGGFLRSARSLIQIIGRATRHVAGTVILYGDRTTSAMQEAMDETRRRRERQEDYNRQHGTVPTPIEEDTAPAAEIVENEV